jgi:hypothetical protein
MHNKTHFILGIKSYMLWHQGAFLTGFSKKDSKSNMYFGASCTCPLYEWLGEGDRGNNPACTKYSELLHRNVNESWRIHKKSRSSQRSIGKSRKLIAHVAAILLGQ